MPGIHRDNLSFRALRAFKSFILLVVSPEEIQPEVAIIKNRPLFFLFDPYFSYFLFVTFTPTAKGHRHAKLLIFDDGGGSPQSVPLKGTGVLH
jgi:hypothetical protein